jgi:hypothetical protein
MSWKRNILFKKDLPTAGTYLYIQSGKVHYYATRKDHLKTSAILLFDTLERAQFFKNNWNPSMRYREACDDSEEYHFFVIDYIDFGPFKGKFLANEFTIFKKIA